MPEAIPQITLDKAKHVHFIGIGGIGMSGLAQLLLAQGKTVSGSDMRPNDNTRKLAALGVQIITGHRAANIAGCDLVVHTSAVKSDNEELKRAVELGIPVMRRAKLLGELCRGKKTIAVAGAHGKTTTTAMVTAILVAAKLHPTFVIGGISNEAGTNAEAGTGPHMVIEADESDGSFIDLRPLHAIVTNIDEEHLDFYPDFEAIQSAMRAFANLLPADGVLFLNRDDSRLMGCMKPLQGGTRKLHYFGLNRPTSNDNASQTWAEVHDPGRPCRFTLHTNGAPLADVTLQIGGLHNISNATAAAAVATTIGCSPEAIVKGLEGYQGVQRRSQLKGDAADVRVYDDYAHHPTEVTSLLSTLRHEVNRRGGKLWAVFQPHRYTRFYHLYDQFLDAYGLADHIIVLPVYSAGETADKMTTCASPSRFAMLLHDKHRRNAVYLQTPEEAVDYLQQQVEQHDVVVTTGAGDVYKVGEWLAQRLASSGVQHAG